MRTMSALCCECGNVRTINGRTKITDKVTEPDDRGWRMTCTARCPVCRRRTAHAVILRDDCPGRDYDLVCQINVIHNRVIDLADTAELGRILAVYMGVADRHRAQL